MKARFMAVRGGVGSTLQNCCARLQAARGESRPAWRAEGEEPDYRFTLANERTFLAWIRTALAILAAGVLLDQFSTRLSPHAWVIAAAALLSFAAAVLCVLSYLRWRGNERAMRHKAPLPHSTVLMVLAAAITLACMVLAALILLPLLGR